MTGSTLPIFMRNLASVQQSSDMIELRVDSIQSLITPDDVRQMRAQVSKISIFTFRASEEGGLSPMMEEDRVELIRYALTLGFDYVDIEYETARKHVFDISGDTKVILSAHDFSHTPTFVQMSEFIHDMSGSALKPDIIKIATMIESDDDIRTILTLQSSHFRLSTVDFRLLLIGMGEKGRLTRILAPLLGAPFTFAASEMGESAPGQINAGKMRDIYESVMHSLHS